MSENVQTIIDAIQLLSPADMRQVRDFVVKECESNVETASQIQLHDEWERRLRSAATDCGVSLTDEAVSSEGLYE